MTIEELILEAIKKNREAYDKAKRDGATILVGSPYSLVLDGEITGKSYGRLAYGTDSSLEAEFGVLDPDTQEFLKIGIKMNDIKSFQINGFAGDVIQAEIETYSGNWIHCPISALKVDFKDIMATEFNVEKLRDKTTESN